MRGAQTHQRRIVGRRGDHHRALDALFAEDVLDEFLYLATTLTDQPDDDDVGLGEARHHAQQHRLADTRAGEQPEALAAPDREQAIDAADADIQRFADGMALERVDHRTIHRHPVLGAHAALAIQGAPSAIEHTTEHGHAHGQASGVDQRHDPRAWRDTGQAADRHQIQLAAGEAHHLGLDLGRVIAVVVDHQATAADRRPQPLGLQCQADHAQQAALKQRLAGQLDRRFIGFETFGETDPLKAHRTRPDRHSGRQPADGWRSPAAARTVA